MKYIGAHHADLINYIASHSIEHIVRGTSVPTRKPERGLSVVIIAHILNAEWAVVPLNYEAVFPVEAHAT
jgi:hypothetical protein